MVALQCLVVVGVITGTLRSACGSSDQCPQAGTYCTNRDRGHDRCSYCGYSPLPEQTDPATGVVLNRSPNAPDFAGYNLTAVAELCAGLSLYAGELHDWVTTSSIVTWCKSGGGPLGRSIP